MLPIPPPLKKLLNLCPQVSAKLYINNLSEIAKKTEVSCIATTTIPAELYDLTFVLMQFIVVPMWVPSTPKGAVRPPPSVPNHRIKKAVLIIRDWLKTARIRKKKRSELRGRANPPHHPIAFARAWQLATGATTFDNMSDT